MRDSYEPPMRPGGPGGPPGAGGPFEPRTQHLPRRAGPYDDFAARMDETAGGTRAAGLRRLSRLTWRSVQLSALATVGFVTLFVRSAPAQTASSQTAVTPSPARTAASRSPSPSPSPSPSKTKAKTAAPKPRPASAAPSAAPAPSPTLAPPTTPPAAPPPAPAPAPVQTTSSGSHGG